MCVTTPMSCVYSPTWYSLAMGPIAKTSTTVRYGTVLYESEAHFFQTPTYQAPTAVRSLDLETVLKCSKEMMNSGIRNKYDKAV